MNKDRSNASAKKVTTTADCKKLVENAEEIIQCPVCMENSGQMEQCVTGHLICVSCKQKIQNNSCPTCKKVYSGTKSFIMTDLTKTLSSLKISLDTLEGNSEKPNNDVEVYRNLIKTILTKMSIFFSNTNTTFLQLSNYLKDPNPNYMNKREIEQQIIMFTNQIHNVQYFMENTKDKLIALKK